MTPSSMEGMDRWIIHFIKQYFFYIRNMCMTNHKITSTVKVQLRCCYHNHITTTYHIFYKLNNIAKNFSILRITTSYSWHTIKHKQALTHRVQAHMIKFLPSYYTHQNKTFWKEGGGDWFKILRWNGTKIIFSY